MFKDRRSKKVIFLAHCLLNQNAISDGTADFPAAHGEIIQFLMDSEVGIVQMPCPELLCLGLDRGNPEGCRSEVVVENTRIRQDLKNDRSRRCLQDLVQQIVRQITEYKKHRFTILGIVGVNRSPSCGVDSTSRDNREVPGEGIFFQALKKSLAEKNLPVKTIGIKGSRISQNLKKIRELVL